MPKYLVSWTEEDWYNVIIEADSAYEAEDKFWGHEFDSEDVSHIGTEIQQGIDVEALIDYNETVSN